MSSQAAMRTAIKEIRRGEELMNVLHSHLQLHSKATDLSQGVIQALSAALSILKSRETTNIAMASGAQKEAISSKKRRPLAASAETNQSERDQKKRKDMNPNSWIVVTPAPYLDGHQWRKYGQKINKQKPKYPRSYYRCTHSDQRCPATKIVQEEECSTESPMFKVIYTNKHTCNASMSDGAEQIVFASPPTPSNFFIFESKKSYSSFQNLTQKEEIFSLNPIKNESNGEKFSLHNKSCSSLINNSTLSDLEMKVKGKEDVSSAPMIKDFPMSPTGLLDYSEFDFGDVDSILSSLE